MPFRTARGMDFMASIATGEAIGDSTRDEGGIVSFFYHFVAEAAALASTLDIFLEDAPPRIFTILRLTERKTKRIRGASTLRSKDE